MKDTRKGFVRHHVLVIKWIQVLTSFMMGLVLAVSTATRLLDFWQMGRGQRVFTFITITLVVSLVVFGALTALIQSFKNSKAVTIIGLVVSIITGGALWVTRIGHNLATPVPDQWLGGWGARLVKLADLAVTTVIIPLVVFSILLVLFFVCSNFFPRARGFLLRIHYPIIFCTVFFGSCLVPLFRSPNLLRLDTEIWQRAEALRLHAMTRFYLGDQVISDAIVSKDNWLVFANNFSTMNYQNVWPLTENELEKIHLDLMAFDEYLANNGIKLIVLIAPDKNTIYPEHMPMEIPVLGEQTRLDQLLEYNASRGGIRIIDLRGELLEARRERVIYYHTDTHWNAYGAYHAYKAIMDEISLDYPQVTAYPLDSLTYKVDPGRTGEGVYMANLDIREEFFTLEPERRRAEGPFYLYNQRAWPTHRAYSVDDGSLPRLLVYQDSFGLELIPFLSEHFSSSLFIWTSKIETAFIDMQNPDIVVIECTERELTRLMNITTTEE